jgi:arylsulfatase A-like enzyme
MREDVPTLAEFLGGFGYETAAIIGNFATLSGFGIQRGFAHYDVTPGPPFFAPRILWLYRAKLRGWSPGDAFLRRLPASVQARSRLFSVKEPVYRRAGQVNAAARQWLHQNGSRPFFLFLNYIDSHNPYLPPLEDDERFVKRPAQEEWFGFPLERFRAAERGAASFTPEEIEVLKGQYDASLFSIDRELAKLFHFLKEAGLFDNTVIFITTDHGESFFEHGFPDHGNSLYQPEIGGFLMVKMPAGSNSVQVSPLMQFVDFFPTFAAILEEPVPGQVQGSAWGAGRDYAFSELFCKGCGREWLEANPWPEALKDEAFAVILGNQKLIRSLRGPDEVYDLSIDPNETKPLSQPDPEFLQRAGQIIARQKERMVEGLSKRPQDKILLEKLRSLGYIQ